MLYLPNASAAQRMTTDELRAHFLVEDLFQAGRLVLRPVDLDRVVLGGAVPTDGPLRLEAPDFLLADFFCERRELGVLGIGGEGTVTVDGTRHAVGNRDVLYVGRGSREVELASVDPDRPARFYLVSYPAHAEHPTRLARAEDAEVSDLGSTEQANRRRIRKYVHAGGVRSAQLVMGVTELEAGSVWNTMPPHTHARRTEVYLYFDVAPEAAVFHLLGEPRETRHLVVRDGEVALSPGWSVHAGCGTRAYTFCWAMGGENQDYADMQPAPVDTLR